MKISDKHSAAARANGARSRGPVTPEGKAASSRNALRHGLFSKSVVLINEDPDAFLELLNNYADRFNPVDDVERAMVEEMAAASWRLRRCISMETAILNKGIEERLDQEPNVQTMEAFRDYSAMADLDRLERYESRHGRAFQRALNNLVKLRKLAKREEDAPIPNEPIAPNVCNTGEGPRPCKEPRLAPPPPAQPALPPVELPDAPVFP